MYQFLTKNGQLLSFGLGALISIVFLVMAAPNAADLDPLSKEEQYQTDIFNFGLAAALALTVIAAVALLLFGVFQTVTNLKSSLKGLIGLAVLIIIGLAAYFTASGEASGAIATAVDKFGGLSVGQLKFIGGAITTAGVLVFIAFVGLFVSEIISFFK